ncbi:sugar ABC transporter permease, partial [Streptococcus pyogenes]
YQKTVSLVYLFYNNSFKYSDKGYGSTIIMLLLLMILVITAAQMKIQKKWVHYN